MRLETRSYEPTPPLLCDACSWPVSINEVLVGDDGIIRGLIICGLCVQDELEARKLENQP